MADDDDIFVKRVDFEVNNNEPTVNDALLMPNGNTQLGDVEKKVKIRVKPTTCCGKFKYYMTKLKITTALSHIGLLLGLGLYCFIGGYVSFIQFFTTNDYQLPSSFCVRTGFYHSLI
jgi:hypothetical protein